MYIDSNTTSDMVFKKMIEGLYFLAEHSDPDTTDKKGVSQKDSHFSVN